MIDENYAFFEFMTKTTTTTNFPFVAINSCLNSFHQLQVFISYLIINSRFLSATSLFKNVNL